MPVGAVARTLDRAPALCALVAMLVSAAITLATPPSLANGRFPTGGYFVVGGGDARGVMVLRATFGLVTSRDAGRTWSWVCEDAFGAVGTFDASVAIASEGRVVLTTPRGLQTSRDDCAWAPPEGNLVRPFIDVAVDATGRTMVTVAGPSGVDDVILRSVDGGASWTRGATLAGLYASTIELAPSNPARVYVSGFLSDGTALLLRSDDGGFTVREVARDAAFLGGTSAYISGIDPRAPDVVYVRSAMGIGTALLRSDDGGVTFRELTRTDGAMTGFALSDDGATVWVGSDDRRDALRRSTRGGPFERLGVTLTTRCLRQRDGVLYVCADEAADGFVLGCSVDGGERVTPLVSARRLAGPPAACAADSPVSTLCAPLWPAQRDALARIDGGAPAMTGSHDAGVDVARDVMRDDVTAEVPRDAREAGGDAAVDAVKVRDAAFDGGVVRAPSQGCGCAVGRRDAGAWARLAWVVLAGWWYARGWRRVLRSGPGFASDEAHRGRFQGITRHSSGSGGRTHPLRG